MCASSYMSFADLESGDGIYITPTMKGLMKQKFSLFRPRNFKYVYRLFRGLQKAKKLNRGGKFEGLTLREALELVPQLSGSTRLMFLCALCLLSSMPCAEVLASPASFFINKLDVHNDVVSPKAVYSVRCMANKTKSYVDALSATFKDNIVLKSQISTIKREGGKVILVMENEEELEYAGVVLACNADQALNLLETPTNLEREILGIWKYRDGTLTVHKDHSHFPPKDLIGAYTFLYKKEEDAFETSVNGALWHEPGVPWSSNYISSQHPNFPIDEKKIEFSTVLRTPVFDFETCASIKKLPTLNGKENTYYCGSHFGFGLHEDAIRSAVEVARKLGVNV